MTIRSGLKYFGIVFVLAGFAGLVFAGDSIIHIKASLADSRSVPGQSADELLRLLQQRNAQLEAELISLRLGANPVAGASKSAKVYSQYPFSNRSEILISLGRRDGIEPGMAVAIGRSALIGRVREVYKTTSSVQTIFDPSFQIPVRVGDQETDALFSGGLTPELTLIDGKISPDDPIVSSFSGLPYGLVLGRVGTATSQNESFVKPAFSLKGLRDVLVLSD
jgi:cell shape-determining protein MreC